MAVDANDAISPPWARPTEPGAPSAGATAAAEATVEVDRPGPWLQVGTIRAFEWRRVTLPVADLPPALDGLWLLHLTDMHLLRRWFPAYDDLIARAHADPPDLVLITGDFVDDRADPTRALPLVERVLAGLRGVARHGVFAIHGNHDGDLLAPRLPAWGARVLTMDHADVAVGGATLELIGLAGPDRNDAGETFLRTFPPRRAGVPRIVLSHYPDVIRDAAPLLRPDVFLAGHTHGGQVRLPGGVPIVTHDDLPRRYASGVHRLHDAWLVVGRGMGFSRWPLRLCCPAEVGEVRLARVNGEG